MDSPAVPNYMDIAQQQAQYNSTLAGQQSRLNNPNQYGPYGSRVTTYNPDGTSSVNTSLSDPLQQQFNNYNNLNSAIGTRSQQLLGQSFQPNNSADDFSRTADAAYSQQKRYLDPQYQQGQSDLDAKLANQGIMPGSDAYKREQNNFNLQKTAAYGDASDRAIANGNTEQQQIFGQNLQSHNSNFNDLASLKSNNQFTMPSFQGTTSTNIGNVDFGAAAQNQYNGNLGNANATNASNSNFNNGLFTLGNTYLQNAPAINSAVSNGWNYMTA